jgi:hypothetical protein
MKPRKIKPVILVNYGLASAFNDHIELHWKLRGNLKKSILAHELRHETGAYSWKDWKNDFQAKKSHFFQAFRFALRHPEALINYFPFMYSYYSKAWTYNLSCLTPFLYFGLIWSVFWLLLFKINLFQAFLGYACIYALVNISLLILTHLKVKSSSFRKPL